MKFIAFVFLVALLFLIPVCSATSFGIPTFEGTDGITYARSGYPNSSIECNESLNYCENYKPAPLSARFYNDGRIYLGKDTDHYIGVQAVGLFYINYENPVEREQLIGLSSVSMVVNDNVVTYSKGPVDIVFTNSYNRVKGDIIFPNTLPAPTVDNPALCIVWEIVGHAGINTDDGEKSDWWFEQAKAYLPLGDIQNNGSKELKKKIFRQNGNIYLVEGVGYSWASSEDRTDPQFIIDPTVIYNGDDSWVGTSGTLLEHGDGNLRSPPSVTEGLVSFWSPGTDIGTGSTLYDIWGDNHGTIEGATWNMTSGMLEYDGTNDYVDFGTAKSYIDYGNTYSLIFELSLYSTQNTRSLLVNDPIDKNTHRNLLQVSSTDNKITFGTYDGSTTQSVTNSAVLNNNQTYYVSAVNTNHTTKNIYVDYSGATGGAGIPAYSSINNMCVGGQTDLARMFFGSIGELYTYNVSLTNDQINETIDNYHAISAYRKIDTAQDAGLGQVWKYVGILGTDAGANTTGLLQINGSSDNVSFSGWQDVGAFDIDDNIEIPDGLEYRYAKFKWYSNTTYQPETDIIENFVMVSPSGMFSSVWNTSLTSTGSSPSTNVKLPLEASGTYSFLVDWGDNSSDIIGTWDQDEVNHTYASEGEYIINITGEITGWRFNNGGDKLKILNITNWGNFAPGNSGNYFQGCSNLNIGATDTLYLNDTSTLSGAFRGCTNLYTLNSTYWNVTGITNYGSAFNGCSNLISLDVSNWNTTNAENFYATFYECSNLQSLDVSNWNTKSVKYFGSAFYSCGFSSIYTSNFNTTSVEDFTDTFSQCTNITSIDVSSWDITSLTDATGMFDGVTLNTSSYDDILLHFASQNVQTYVYFSGGNSMYTEGMPQSARNDTLIDTYNWIITDGGMIPETTPPTYSSEDHNSTAAGMPVLFSLTCNDNVALETNGQYIFSTNNTGEWVNSTPVNFTSTPEIATNTTTLNSTIGITIWYRWYISDNRNNTNSTPIYTLLTTEPINNRMPLSLFIMWSVIMFAGSVFSFITTGPKAIILSLVSATIAYMNSKLIISGDVVQYFAGVSSTDTIVTGYRTIESAALSYVFLFIALFLAIVFIAHVINELNYQLSPDLEVWADE